MFSHRIPILLATAAGLGCSEQVVAPKADYSPMLRASMSLQVVHHVSVGGPDACFAFGVQPGCDANFSLVAVQGSDGSVTGEYTDRSPSIPTRGFHAVVDCLNVVGKQAWVSGLLDEPQNLAGVPVITMVVDNGTSANDPADSISFSFVDPAQFGVSASCLDAPDLPLFAAPQGQV